MNKQELYDKINQLPSVLGWQGHGVKLMVAKDSVLELVRQLEEPKKPTVPEVALEYYEAYVDKLTGFDEWFGDFFDRSFLEEFPKAEELSEWLYDNDTKTNLERELALATLVVKGPSAVKIEKEKLYTVEIPNPNSTLNEFQALVLGKNGHGKIQITQFLPAYDWKNDGRCQLTEAEIRKDFDWAWQFAKEVG